MQKSRSSTSGSYTESHCMDMRCALPTSQYSTFERRESFYIKVRSLIDKISTSSSRRSGSLCLLFPLRHHLDLGIAASQTVNREIHHDSNHSSTRISKQDAFLIAPHPLHPPPPPHLHHLPPTRHLPLLLSRTTTPP